MFPPACQLSDSIRRVVGDVAARGVSANLVGGCEVDAGSVIRALVIVPVVLVLATELDEVIPLQLGEVIGEVVILAVPDTGPDVLCVDVVRSHDDCGTLAERFNCPGSTCDLSRSVCTFPLPEVTQVAVVEVIGEGGADVGRKPDHKEPGLLRPGRYGLGNAKCAAQNAANVDLIGSEVGEAVITVARH